MGGTGLGGSTDCGAQGAHVNGTQEGPNLQNCHRTGTDPPKYTVAGIQASTCHPEAKWYEIMCATVPKHGCLPCVCVTHRDLESGVLNEGQAQDHGQLSEHVHGLPVPGLRPEPYKVERERVQLLLFAVDSLQQVADSEEA